MRRSISDGLHLALGLGLAERSHLPGGELVAASLGSELHVFDLATGLHKWSAAPGHAEDTTHVFLSSPCISGNTVLVGAAACLKVKWYTSIQDMVVGLERVSFATAGNFSFRTTLFRVALLLTIELFPFVVLATVHVAWVQWVCLGLIILGLMNAIRIVRWGNGNVAAAFLYPVGALIFSLIVLRGGWLGRRRGGVWWRGTFYPTEVLRKGKRVRMM